MNDTSEEMGEIQRGILRNKTNAERFMMTIEMYQINKVFVKCGILNNHPNISPLELKKEIFKRFYSADFEKEELRKILENIA